MNSLTYTLSFVAVAMATASTAAAQELRKGLADADLVVVGREVSQTTIAEGLLSHRIQIIEGIRGRNSDKKAITVLDWTRLSLHNRPTVRQSRLYCLVDASHTAKQLELSPDDGPYYKMVGWAGSNPLIGRDLERDATARFARTLAAAEAGTSSAVTAASIAQAALSSDKKIRVEAAKLLTERPFLRARLSATDWSRLMTRTAGETENIAYKIVLAELCAEQRLNGLVDALIVGINSVKDPDYARAVGRLIAHLRGDDAAEPILRRLQTHNDPAERPALLMALGSTRTARALDALLQIKRSTTDDAAVDAALRAHRSRQAKEAVSRKK